MTNNNPQIYSIPATLSQFFYDNVGGSIINVDATWDKAWMMPDLLNPGKSLGFRSKDGIYKRMIRNRQNPKQQVATITPSSGLSTQVTLTWADPSFNLYQIGDIIRDEQSLAEGRVIKAIPGSVIIEANFSPSPQFDCTLHFQPGYFTYYEKDRSIMYGSGGKENRFYENTWQDDFSEIANDTCVITRREEFNSLLGKNGDIYVWSQKEIDFINFHNRARGKSYWFGNGGVRNTSQGRLSGTFGIRESIIGAAATSISPARQGGTYIPLGSAPVLQTVFDMQDAMASKKGADEQNFVFGFGRAALGAIQQDPTIKNMITYPGVENTIGGASVKGLDVRTMSLNGITIKFMILPFLSDTDSLPSWNRWSIYGFDLTPYPTINMDGSVGSEPPMMKIHFGDGEEAPIYSMVPGKEGVASMNANLKTGAYKIASNLIDGYTLNLQRDNGLSCYALNWALAEWQGGN